MAGEGEGGWPCILYYECIPIVHVFQLDSPHGAVIINYLWIQYIMILKFEIIIITEVLQT